MSTSSADAPRPLMEVPGSRTSSVIVHKVPPDRAERFMEWQRGVTQVTADFPGYQGTEVYPPADRRQPEWVAVVHFDAPEDLQRWLDSPVRSEWTAKLRSEIGDFRLKTMPTGFDPWFAEFVRGPEEGLPPSWKMALTVLLGLYPTVMLLAWFVAPYTSHLGLALSMLISNTLSVSILQYAVMPVLSARLGPWLHAKPDRGKAFSVGGLAVILLLLGALTVLFRQVTG
jgi:antibiotic biosynthesis monooxygenase (ABM) superfamily enzyme